MKQRELVLFLGDVNIDTLMWVEELPSPGHESHSRRIETHLGGSAANTAVVWSRLGMISRLIACLGEDMWGEMAKKYLISTGVDTAHLQATAALATGMNFIAVLPNGERTMFGYRGANTVLSPDALSPHCMEGCSVLHLSGYAFLDPCQSQSAQQCIRWAWEKEIPISLDTAFEPILQKPEFFRSLLPQLSIFISGMDEIKSLCPIQSPQEAANYLLNQGISLAAIKLGSQGCYLASRQYQSHFPSMQIQVIDTTGAGDSFSAALLFGWLNKMPFEKIGLFANAMGGLAAAVTGAGENLPGIQQLRDYLISDTHNIPQDFLSLVDLIAL